MPDPEPRDRRYRYDAFVSYSRAVDGKLAPALESALQKLPSRGPDAGLRVFRDNASLSTNPALWSSITAAGPRAHSSGTRSGAGSTTPSRVGPRRRCKEASRRSPATGAPLHGSHRGPAGRPALARRPSLPRRRGRPRSGSARPAEGHAEARRVRVDSHPDASFGPESWQTHSLKGARMSP